MNMQYRMPDSGSQNDKAHQRFHQGFVSGIKEIYPLSRIGRWLGSHMNADPERGNDESARQYSNLIKPVDRYVE